MKLCVTGHDSKGKAIFSHAGAPPRAAVPPRDPTPRARSPDSMSAESPTPDAEPHA